MPDSWIYHKASRQDRAIITLSSASCLAGTLAVEDSGEKVAMHGLQFYL